VFGTDPRSRSWGGTSRLTSLCSHVVEPTSKASYPTWWVDRTVGIDLSIAGVHTDEVYEAMDWVTALRATEINKLVADEVVPPSPTTPASATSSRCSSTSSPAYHRDGPAVLTGRVRVDRRPPDWQP
jgi:hypothetical protein